MRYRALVAVFLALCLGFLTACSGEPDPSKGPLTYADIKDTGLANSCPQIGDVRRGSISIALGQAYAIREMCLEPTSFFVKEEPANKRQQAEYIEGRSLTRYTSSLDQVSGELKLTDEGELTFYEEDGFDFQPITVLLPGGEEVPFLFTIKGLVAKAIVGTDGINTSTDFEGTFRVPSYRTSNFLDPKGRGLATGYDNAVALPAGADDEELLAENVKRFDVGAGTIFFQISNVDSTSGEIAGTFESEQPSDTDMGSNEPSDVKVRGIFYARVES
ncbi:MAG: Photosystem II manganese-stabilizing polypeptide [Cyanothece sp. SIO2G6]|nr:Photosystem II manganese-stabilizing polypeptide [Cyanothece sp. SIO2G6]